MKMGIGRGKDLSSSAVKIGVKTRPLSYVGVAITRKEFYQMGHRNSFTWEQVCWQLLLVALTCAVYLYRSTWERLLQSYFVIYVWRCSVKRSRILSQLEASRASGLLSPWTLIYGRFNSKAWHFDKNVCVLIFGQIKAFPSVLVNFLCNWLFTKSSLPWWNIICCICVLSTPGNTNACALSWLI